MMNARQIRDDLFAGLTVAVVALPLALAFGVASGAGALAGLYGAIFAGFFAALTGGTPRQVSGPTGPMTVVMAIVIPHFAPDISIAFLVVILAGAMQISLGKLGIGKYINLMPQPVISGFMSGIGVIIILLQLGALIGYATPPGGIVDKLFALPSMLPQSNFSALILGTMSILIIVFIPPTLKRYIPPALIALVVGTVLGTFVFTSAPTIGDIPSAFPTLRIPTIDIDRFVDVIKFAFVLAILGSIDSLLTSLVADNMTRTTHDPNKELVGQGIGNMVAGFFGGLPAAGATMLTMVNIRSGSHGRMSGVLHGVFLLLIVLLFSDIASKIPLAVLGGILVMVGINIIDWHSIKRLSIAPVSEVLIMSSTLILTVFVDLTIAVIVGFVISSVLLTYRIGLAFNRTSVLYDDIATVADLTEAERQIITQFNQPVSLYKMDGTFSFSAARHVSNTLLNNVQQGTLIIDMSRVVLTDSSACHTLKETIDRLNENIDSVKLCCVDVEKVLRLLQKSEVVDIVGEDNIFESRSGAIRSLLD